MVQHHSRRRREEEDDDDGDSVLESKKAIIPMSEGRVVPLLLLLRCHPVFGAR